jgi:hypothetical protein
LHSLVPPDGKAVLNVFGDPTGAHFSYRGTQHHFLMNVFPELYGGKTFHLKARAPRPAGLAVSIQRLLKETLGEEAKDYLPVLGKNNDDCRNLAGSVGSSGRKDKKNGSPSNESEAINSFDARNKPHDASSNDLINRDASSSGVRVFTTKDEFEEASLVASSIRRLVEKGDYKPEEIAVTARDKQRYEAVIAMACRQHGIPLQTGKSERSAFRNLIISLIGFLRNTEDEISLNALLTSSLRDHLEEALQGLIRSEGIDDDGKREDEGKGKGKGGGGGLLQNPNAGVRISDDSQGKGKSKREAEAAGLPELLKAFAQNLKKLDPDDWMNEVSEKLILPVARKAAPSASGLSLEVLAMEFRQDWDDYDAASKRFKAKGGVSSYLKLSPLFAETAGKMVPARGRVGFYSCHELSNRFFPVVFLMGCSETVFPALERKDEFFPYEELEEALAKTAASGIGTEAGRKKVDLRSNLSLAQNRTPEESLRNEYGLLLHALTRATEKLTITAPEMLGDEQYPAPSDIIRSTLGGKRLDEASGTIAPPFVSLARTAAKAATEEAAEVGSEPAAKYAARDSAHPAAANAKIDTRITALMPLAGLWPHEPCESKAFSIERFSLSSSALDLFTRCNRLFFYRRVLRVPERELIYYKPGSLFHIMLERLCSKYRTHDAILGPRARTEITKLIDKVIAEDGDISPGTFYENLLQKQLGELAGAFFALEEAREGTYTIEDLESCFEFSYDAWNFKGYMDRIDRIEGEKDFLIDYKTGTKEVRTGETLRKKVVEEDTFSKNKNWQVPLYVWARYERERAFPYAYSHYLTPTDKEPKMVSVFILKNEREWEPLSASFGGKSAASSYLLESEVEECIQEASTVAKAIFAPREFFERTDDKRGTCRMCPFKRTCLRSADGSE